MIIIKYNYFKSLVQFITVVLFDNGFLTELEILEALVAMVQMSKSYILSNITLGVSDSIGTAIFSDCNYNYLKACVTRDYCDIVLHVIREKQIKMKIT